jgi:hypothetical protein
MMAEAECDSKSGACPFRGSIMRMEGRMGKAESVIEHIANEFFNHDGGPGLKTIVLARFAADDQRHRSEKAFHELRDKETKEALLAHEKTIKTALETENTKTAKRGLVWQIAGVMASIASVCVAILMLVCTWYVIHHASMEPLDLFQKIQASQVIITHSTPPPQLANE